MPSPAHDRTVFAARAAQQRRLALGASHPAAAAAHHRLAELLEAAARPPRPVLRLFEGGRRAE